VVTTIERERATPRLPSPAETEDATRREFLVGAAGLLSLAPYGCGGGAGGGEPSGQTRTVEHLLGETEVPENPGRVVTLDTTPTDAALAVGIVPVGAPIVGEGFPKQLAGKLQGTESVGTPEQPNLEAIAALDPDLILCGEWQGDLYDRLSEIAPTVADGSTTEDWKADMRLDARALGREERMEEELSAYEDWVAEFRERMGERLEELTVSLVIFYADSLRIYMPESFMGMVVKAHTVLDGAAARADWTLLEAEARGHPSVPGP